MAIHDTYGTRNLSAEELAAPLAPRLGVTFAQHASYYRGVYLTAEAGLAAIEIQPNSIPGDDDDLYAPEHAAFQTLVLVTAPGSDGRLNTILMDTEGLEALAHKTF
jgi:hypothetical protein